MLEESIERLKRQYLVDPTAVNLRSFLVALERLQLEGYKIRALEIIGLENSKCVLSDFIELLESENAPLNFGIEAIVHIHGDLIDLPKFSEFMKEIIEEEHALIENYISSPTEANRALLFQALDASEDIGILEADLTRNSFTKPEGPLRDWQICPWIVGACLHKSKAAAIFDLKVAAEALQQHVDQREIQRSLRSYFLPRLIESFL